MGKVKYIVNKNNPANFIYVDEKGITTHSVGRRPERGADGVVRYVVYDRYGEGDNEGWGGGIEPGLCTAA